MAAVAFVPPGTVAFASRHGQTVDAQRELLALSGANLGAGLVGGLPVSSSGSRSHEGPRKPSGSTSFLSTEMAAITARAPMTTAMPTSRA